MNIHISSLTYQKIMAVLLALRERDVEELKATRGVDKRGELPKEQLIRDCLASTIGFVVSIDDRPVACIGASQVRKGVFQVWAFATDDFRRVAIFATRFVSRVMIPIIYSLGAHRAHCFALVKHFAARRWLSLLGATCEGTLKGWGMNGEDFVIMRWSREDVRRS